jgi:hypothetical protein
LEPRADLDAVADGALGDTVPVRSHIFKQSLTLFPPFNDEINSELFN